MIKKLLLLTVLSIWLNDTNASDSIDSRISFDSTFNKIDTMYVMNNDSILFNTPLESNGLSKVLIMSNSDDNLWVSIGLPIFMLLLGIAIPLLVDRFSKRRKSKKILKRWVAELRCLESPIQKQIEANEKFITEQSEETFEINAPTFSNVLDCNIFQTMDKGEFLQAIESIKKIDYKEAVKISNSTHGYINILTNTYATLMDKFQKYLDETSNYVSIFSEHFDELLKAYADYGVALEKQTGEDPYITNNEFRQITDLFSVHVMPNLDTGKYNVFELETVFFQPLLKLLSELRLDERINPMKSHLSKCVRAIKAIRMERIYVAKNMENVADNYKSQLTELENVVQPLESS